VSLVDLSTTQLFRPQAVNTCGWLSTGYIAAPGAGTQVGPSFQLKERGLYVISVTCSGSATGVAQIELRHTDASGNVFGTLYLNVSSSAQNSFGGQVELVTMEPNTELRFVVGPTSVAQTIACSIAFRLCEVF
jgi:hypothetical protein